MEVENQVSFISPMLQNTQFGNVDDETTMCLTELCGSALVHGRGISTLWGQMY